MNVFNFKLVKSIVAVSSLITALNVNAANLPELGEYQVDATHTSVNFAVSHMGFTDLRGRFNQVEGSVIVGNGKDSKLNIVIKTASIDTNHKKRDDHLRSPDFFNARQFPEIKFTSPIKIIEQAGESFLSGEIEMLGVTKPVKLNLKQAKAAKDPWGLYRIGYSAEVVVKRSDFGMNFMQGGVGDEIAIEIEFEAIKQ